MRWVNKSVVWILCLPLAGGAWGQGPDKGFSYLMESIAAYEQSHWRACVEGLEKGLLAGFEEPLHKLDALVLLGRAYARLGEIQRAEVFFRQVLDAQPLYRLDESDPNGVEVFRTLLAVPDRQQKSDPPVPGGLPGGKLLLGAVVVGGAASVLLLLSAGGGTDAPDTGTVQGPQTPLP